MIRLIACVIGGALVAATHPDHCSALNIEFQRWWVRWERQDGSPSAVNTLMRKAKLTLLASCLSPCRQWFGIGLRDPTVGIEDGRSPAKHLPRAKLDYRFRESCHKRGIHLSFQAPMCGALRTKD